MSELDEGTFSAISEELDSPGPTTSLGVLRGRLRSAAATNQGLDADVLLEALLGASGVTIWRGSSSSEVATAIAEFPELNVPPERREPLTYRLQRLLDSESLQTIAKGLDVLTEHERVFLKSRIVTDIRPAYAGSDISDPSAVVLVHTLRLDVQESGHMKSIYVAMDEADLRQLRTVLDREADKATGLRRRIEMTELPLLDFEDDDDGNAVEMIAQ
ncbi:MAG TPA: hypothetical protein VM784_15165 [Actinomycetota bacterium]|nr:hypothetical protein [Actinomycetota bacterium]